MVREDLRQPDVFAARLCLARTRSENPAASDARGQLLQLCRPALLALARAMLPWECNSIHDAEDFVQDAFLKAHRSLDQFEGQALPELRGWLSTILKHTIINFQLSCEFRRLRDGTIVRLYDRDGRLAFTVAVEDWPGSDLEREETCKAVKAVLPDLSALHQRVLVYCYDTDFSIQQVANLMGRTEGAIRKLQERVLKALHCCLHQKGFTPA